MYNGVYTSEQYAYVHDTLIKWLDLKVHGKTLGSCLIDKGVKKVAVYGINDFGRMVCDDIAARKEHGIYEKNGKV